MSEGKTGISELISALGDNNEAKAVLAEVIAEVLLGKTDGTNEWTGDPPEFFVRDIRANREKLKETEAAHADAEKRLPKHDWLDWYAAFITGRNNRMGPASAAVTADMYVNWVLKKVKEANKAEEGEFKPENDSYRA